MRDMPAERHMSGPEDSFVSGQISGATDACRHGWKVLKQQGPGKVQFWFIALVIGIAAGFAALFSAKGSIGYRPLFTGPKMSIPCIVSSPALNGTGLS